MTKPISNNSNLSTSTAGDQASPTPMMSLKVVSINSAAQPVLENGAATLSATVVWNQYEWTFKKVVRLSPDTPDLQPIRDQWNAFVKTKMRQVLTDLNEAMQKSGKGSLVEKTSFRISPDENQLVAKFNPPLPESRPSSPLPSDAPPMNLEEVSFVPKDEAEILDVFTKLGKDDISVLNSYTLPVAAKPQPPASNRSGTQIHFKKRTNGPDSQSLSDRIISPEIPVLRKNRTKALFTPNITPPILPNKNLRCYLNTALWSILANKNLCETISNLEISDDNALGKALQDFVSGYLNKPDAANMTSDLIQKAGNFNDFVQGDAHEALTALLNSIAPNGNLAGLGIPTDPIPLPPGETIGDALKNCLPAPLQTLIFGADGAVAAAGSVAREEPIVIAEKDATVEHGGFNYELSSVIIHYGYRARSAGANLNAGDSSGHYVFLRRARLGNGDVKYYFCDDKYFQNPVQEITEQTFYKLASAPYRIFYTQCSDSQSSPSPSGSPFNIPSPTVVGLNSDPFSSSSSSSASSSSSTNATSSPPEVIDVEISTDKPGQSEEHPNATSNPSETTSAPSSSSSSPSENAQQPQFTHFFRRRHKFQKKITPTPSHH